MTNGHRLRVRVLNRKRGFYGRLTNPRIALSADALIGADGDLQTLAERHGAGHATVSIFPPSTSRESHVRRSIRVDDFMDGVQRCCRSLGSASVLSPGDQPRGRLRASLLLTFRLIVGCRLPSGRCWPSS